MSLEVYKKENQAVGEFNGGAILENKPIGFPQDNGSLKPYSNIIYWAHAWTPGDESLIGEHPHQGFEILSFVIKGSMKHYDTKLQEWQDLDEGDVQIIRAGSGISHAEKVNRKTSFFQIWFDPNLNLSLKIDASYDNYQAAEFVVSDVEGAKIKNYTDEDSPLKMFSSGVEIYEIMLDSGSYSLPLDSSKLRSFYILEGSLVANNRAMEMHDFVRFQSEDVLELSTQGEARIFVIDLLKEPGYTTYAQQNRLI